MTFGQRIRELRTAKGLSQQQMASELGITPQAYSLIERDESGKAYEKLPVMARALGSTIDGLFPEMDPEPREKTDSAGGFEETRPAEVKENEWAGMTF